MRHKKKGARNESGRIFLKSPNLLVELSLILTDLMNNGKYGFIFMDSFSDLFETNNMEEVNLFLSYLAEKVLLYNSIAVILSMENKRTIDLLPFIAELLPGRFEFGQVTAED